MATKQPPMPIGKPAQNGPLKGSDKKPQVGAAAAAGAAKAAATAVKPEPELPPDPTVFQKYSQHHEFPLSTMASVVAHCLVMLMAALAAGLIFSWGSDREPPAVDNIVFAGGGGDGERGGDPSGSDDLKEVMTFDPDRVMSDTPTVTFSNEDLSNAIAETTKERVIEEARSAERLARGNDPTKRAGDIGRGGPGTGGGLGSGHGTGEGSGSGPGKMTKRAYRTGRWQIVIRFSSGQEYLDKLINLNSMVAFPEGKSQFRLFRDLKNKAGATVESSDGLTRLNRLWWNNEDPEAVSGLAQALGVAGNPPRCYVFMPYDLEQALLKKELDHAKMTEAQINERKIVTKFDVTRSGNNWVIKVLEQGRETRKR